MTPVSLAMSAPARTVDPSVSARETARLMGLCSATDLARVLPTHHIRAIELAGHRRGAGERTGHATGTR